MGLLAAFNLLVGSVLETLKDVHLSQETYNRKPGGIITLLDEAFMFPNSTHETFAQKLNQNFKNNKRFLKPKLSRTDFTISHYAGAGTYQADHFLDKNKDYLGAEHQDLLSPLTCPFVAGLFPPLPEETSTSSKISSIGSGFQLQLQAMMETLSSTEPHYIRFVKPNSTLKPSIFENMNVIQQQRCDGLLEAIRTSCAGYPTGKPFYEFRHCFNVLCPEVLDGNSDDKVACQKNLDKLGLKGYQLGKKKLFLRAGQMEELDARRTEVLGRAAKTIQRQIRTHIARKEFLMLRRSATHLQSCWRAKLARKLCECMRREAAAIKIQKNMRRFSARKSYGKLRSSAILLQTGLRTLSAQLEFRYRKQTKTAIIIQAKWRSHREYSYYKNLKNAAIAYQCAWRQRLERRELRKLKMAARETDALKEAKEKLEKRVEELTWLLVLEKRLRTDLEETKTQEIAKLQDALHEKRQQLDEAVSIIIKQREAAQKAIEEAPLVIKETPIIFQDAEKINSMTAEVECLKDMTPAVVNAKEPESKERPQKSLNEKQQEYQDLFIRCITQDLGFSIGKPIAACLIYKCLLQWRSIEVKRTTIFDKIIQAISSVVEGQDNKDVLCYWLSNCSTLLLLLQRTFKASGAASSTPQSRRTPSASLFGRMSHGIRASQQTTGLPFLNGRLGNGLNDLGQVEAKYPALLFKQQLTAFLEKIYGMIRDNLKKELSPFMFIPIIQAPRTYQAGLMKGSRSQVNAMAQQALIAHWRSIVNSLDSYLKSLKANYVPPFLVCKLFTQIFSFINVQLFNSLILQRECCSFNNGEFVKAGLAELEHWCYAATEEYAGFAWDELKHIRQAVGFLVIHQKPKKTLREITNDLCPVLSIQQLYRISTMYWDDKYGTHKVSSEVISSMKILMTAESNNSVSSSFLLDDDSSIPFSVDDISKSMEQIDPSDVDPPPMIRENSGFSFLLQRAK